MSLKATIDTDIKQAMLAKDKDALRALRNIKAAILLEETKGGAPESLSVDTEMKLLMRMVKQRRDSATTFTEQNRPDLAEGELSEVAIIDKYLPKQLDEDQVTAMVQSIITNLGASTPGDLGKVMGAATKELAGQADNKTVSAIVKKLLGA